MCLSDEIFFKTKDTQKLRLNEIYVSKQSFFFNKTLLYYISTIDGVYIGWFKESEYSKTFIDLSVFREQKLEKILN